MSDQPCSICEGAGYLDKVENLMRTLLKEPPTHVLCPDCVERAAHAIYREAEDVFGDSIFTWSELPESEVAYWRVLAVAAIRAFHGETTDE